MKFVLLLAVLAVAYLAWRAARRREEAGRQPPPAPAAPPLHQDMVRCPVCSLHLPRTDALPGASGRLYCSHEHRASGGN